MNLFEVSRKVFEYSRRLQGRALPDAVETAETVQVWATAFQVAGLGADQVMQAALKLASIGAAITAPAIVQEAKSQARYRPIRAVQTRPRLSAAQREEQAEHIARLKALHGFNERWGRVPLPKRAESDFKRPEFPP